MPFRSDRYGRKTCKIGGNGIACSRAKSNIVNVNVKIVAIGGQTSRSCRN